MPSLSPAMHRLAPRELEPGKPARKKAREQQPHSDRSLFVASEESKVKGQDNDKKVREPRGPHRKNTGGGHGNPPARMAGYTRVSHAQKRRKHPHQRARFEVNHLAVVQFHR